MKTRRLLTAALIGATATFGLVGGSAGPASATSILVDQGATTFDPNTQLEWLDVTFTTNHSYDEVAGGYHGLTTTKGWRFATVAELKQLITDGGGGGSYPQDDVEPSDNATYDVALNLTQLLGANTSFDNGFNSAFASQGFLADPFGVGFHKWGEIFASKIGGVFTGTLEPDGHFIFDNRADPNLGSFLVHTTPIPASLPLLVTALGGLGFLARRRKAA